jgi:hypothetical protein
MVHMVHRYFDVDQNNFMSGITSGTVNYETFPKMFPNKGKFERSDNRSKLAFEVEGGIVYGRLSGNVDIKGKTGLDLGFGGYLIGGKYNYDKGGEAYLPQDQNMEINAGLTYRGFGPSYTGTFNTSNGNIGNSEGGFSLPYSGQISSDGKSSFIGIGGTLAAGLGLTGKIGIRYSPQPTLSGAEKALKSAIEQSKSRGKVGTKNDATETTKGIKLMEQGGQGIWGR